MGVSTDFGADVSCWDDIDPLAVDLLPDDTNVVAQDAYHRLITPKGSLLDDPDWGIDILDFIHQPASAAYLASLPGIVRSELAKDDRIDSVEVTVTLQPSDSMRISVRGETADGPFDFVVGVSASGTELVEFMST